MFSSVHHLGRCRRLWWLFSVSLFYYSTIRYKIIKIKTEWMRLSGLEIGNGNKNENLLLFWCCYVLPSGCFIDKCTETNDIGYCYGIGYVSGIFEWHLYSVWAIFGNAGFHKFFQTFPKIVSRTVTCCSMIVPKWLFYPECRL